MFFKNAKGFVKGMTKTIRKGMSIGEKVINAADKATGGALRSSAAALTGGKSELALQAYNKSKGSIKKGLDVIEGKSNIKKALEGTKYESKYNKGIDYLKKGEKIASETGMINKARSSELGRKVLNTGIRIKPALGI